jgi:uncharacterized damage-inducible protein DinB
MTTDDLLPLVRHMEWADARIWRATLALPERAAADAAMRELMTHVHVVQRAFLQIWCNAPLTAMADAEKVSDLVALMAWARPYYGEARQVLGDMTERDLQREIIPPWARYFVPDGSAPGAATLAETVLQVAMHTTHHRAQLATRIRALGATPPNTDFIAWIWHGRPEPEWEFNS